MSADSATGDGRPETPHPGPGGMSGAPAEAVACYQDLAASIPGAVYQFVLRPDQQVRIPFISPSAAELFDRPVEELHDHGRLFDNVLPEDVPDMHASIEESARTLNMWRKEFRIRTPQGQVKWLRGVSRPRQQADGSVLWNGVLLDVTEQKQAEHALRCERDRAQKYFEIAGTVMVVLDRQGRVERINRRGCGLLGYPQNALLGADWFETCLPAEERNPVRGIFEQILAGQLESFDRVEGKVLTAGGDVRIFAWRNTVIRDDSGAIVGTLSSGEDVTESRSQQEEIVESEARLRRLYDSISAGIMVRGPDGRVRQVNTAAERILDLSAEVLLGTTPGDTVFQMVDEQGRDIPPSQRPSMIALTSRQAVRGVVRGIATTGPESIRWLLIDAVPVLEPDNANLVEVVITFQEITELRKAQQALAEREELLQDVLDAMGAGIFAVDLDSATIQYVNPTAAACLGWGRDDLIGRPWEQIVCGAPGAELSLLQQDAQIAAGERELLTVDGRRVPVLISTARACLDGRDCLLESFIDLTQLKESEAERERLEQQLRHAQKMEAVGQLAGGVAHDFNNLLQAIGGYTDLAMIEADLAGEPIREHLQEVKKAAERAGALTRQLLTFSRRETLQPRLLDLNDVLGDLLKMLRRVLGEHIDLQVKTDSRLSKVFADAGQIEQIIVNLCVNARDAMEAGGTLTISTCNVTFSKDQCRQWVDIQPGRYVCLSVQDTGVGISPELQSRVFEPFFTTKEVGQGTGLGLATVYAIVKQHGGLVALFSEPGAGTEFRICLPVARPGQGEPTEDRGAAPAIGGTETILLAEDDAAVRGFAEEVLRQAGYTVLTAEDGQAAIDMIASERVTIDAAVIDVVMPRAGGREVCQVLRKAHPACAVVFTSGYSYASLDETDLPPGSELIQKPYPPQALLRKLRELLDRR